MNHNTQCQLCQKSVELQLAANSQPISAWRTFVCPHCHKTNFILLPAPISTAAVANNPPVDVPPAAGAKMS